MCTRPWKLPSAQRHHGELQLRTSAVYRRPSKLHTDGHVNNLTGNTGRQRCLNSGTCEISTVSTTTAQESSPCRRNTLRNDREFSASCNCGSTNVFSTTAPENLPRPAQQGNRPPCRRTGESLWSDNSLDHGKPPLRINREENLHDLQPGTSITLRSNWRNSVVHKCGPWESASVPHQEKRPKKPRRLTPNMYPLSNQRVLITERIPEVFSQKIHILYSSGEHRIPYT